MREPIKYRPQKGGYAESMKEAVEIQSIAELESVIEKTHPKEIHNWTNIGFRKLGAIDERNGWDSHVVTVIFEGQTTPSGVGFSNGVIQN